LSIGDEASQEVDDEEHNTEIKLENMREGDFEIFTLEGSVGERP